MPQASESIKKAFSTIGSTVGASTAASSLPIIAANPALLWGFVKLLQGFFYFLFFNVQYPPNLKAFLEICNVGTFSFAPNFFESIGQTSLPSPPHFYRNGHTGQIYHTAGPTLTIWIGMFCIVGFLTVLNKLLPSKRLEMLRATLVGEIRPMWQTSFIDLLYASLLQIRVYKFTKGPAGIVALFLATIIVLFSAGYGVYLFIILKRKPKTNPPAKKWVEFTEYAQRFFHPFCMIFFYQFPFQQIAALWTLNGMQLVVLFWGGVSNNGLAFFNELAFFLMHIMTSYLIYDDISPSRKENIGWVVIALCLVVLAVDLLSMIFVAGHKVYTLLMSKKPNKDYSKIGGPNKSNKSPANRLKRLSATSNEISSSRDNF